MLKIGFRALICGTKQAQKSMKSPQSFKKSLIEKSPSKVYRSGQREVRPVEPEAQDVGEHDAGVAESCRHHAERTPDFGMDRLGKVNGQRQRHDSETRIFSGHC